MNTMKLAIFAGLLFPVAALADDALEVSVGHAALMRLSASPAQIVVGDPTIADITVQSAKSLAVFGKRAGGTSLAGLDSKGAVLWERTVVVVQADAGGVSIHYGSGKNWSPGGASVTVACSSVHCSDPTQPSSDTAQKSPAK